MGEALARSIIEFRSSADAWGQGVIRSTEWGRAISRRIGSKSSTYMSWRVAYLEETSSILCSYLWRIWLSEASNASCLSRFARTDFSLGSVKNERTLKSVIVRWWIGSLLHSHACGPYQVWVVEWVGQQRTILKLWQLFKLLQQIRRPKLFKAWGGPGGKTQLFFFWFFFFFQKKGLDSNLTLRLAKRWSGFLMMWPSLLRRIFAAFR